VELAAGGARVLLTYWLAGGGEEGGRRCAKRMLRSMEVKAKARLCS